MELNASYDIEHSHSTQSIEHDMWPLDPIDPKKAKFPCCLVWNPLPVVSWLAPFIGHVGICREDGVILDFSGSNFVNVDDFAFGAVARYLQLDRRQVLYLNFAVCISCSPVSSDCLHSCKHGIGKCMHVLWYCLMSHSTLSFLLAIGFWGLKNFYGQFLCMKFIEVKNWCIRKTLI